MIQTLLHDHKPRDVGGTGSKAQSCLAVCTRCIFHWLRRDPALHAVGGLKQGDRCWRWQESCGSMMNARQSAPVLPARAAFIRARMHGGAGSGAGSRQQVSLNRILSVMFLACEYGVFFFEPALISSFMYNSRFPSIYRSYRSSTGIHLWLNVIPCVATNPIAGTSITTSVVSARCVLPQLAVLLMPRGRSGRKYQVRM